MKNVFYNDIENEVKFKYQFSRRGGCTDRRAKIIVIGWKDY